MQPVANKDDRVRVKVTFSAPHYLGQTGTVESVGVDQERNHIPVCAIRMDCDGRILYTVNTASWIEVLS